MEKKITEAEGVAPSITPAANAEWKEYKKNTFGMTSNNLVFGKGKPQKYADTPSKAPPKSFATEAKRKSKPSADLSNKKKESARKAPPSDGKG